MSKRTVTREYEAENGYSGNDGYKLYARFVNDRPEVLKIGLKGDNLSTRAMKLLAEDIDSLAQLIEADLEVPRRVTGQVATDSEASND